MTAITAQPVYGESKVHFVKAQTAFDTHAAMAATDGFKCMKMDIKPSKEWKEVKEANGHGSQIAPLAGKRGGKWSAQFHLMPQTSGTPMDAGPFLKAGMGTETGSVYTLSATANPIQLAECAIGEYWREASGACVEQIEIDIPAGEAPTITASGSFARFIWSNRGSAAAGAAAQKVVTVTEGHDGNWSVDAAVDLTGTGNTNRMITAVTPATPSFTVDANITTELGVDSVIIPYCPTPTTAGNRIGIGNHALTIGGVTYSFIKSKITIKPGFHLRDKEANVDRANGIFAGPPVVEFEVELYWFDAKQSAVLGKTWDGSTNAVSLRIGENTTAKRCTLAMPAVRFDLPTENIPEEKEGTVTLKGTALMSSAAYDELVWTFD